LSRQDRYQDIAANLPVKEVRIAGLSPLANIDGTYGRAISNIGGLWSGPQDDPPAAAALPGRLDLGEGHLVDVDRQSARNHVAPDGSTLPLRSPCAALCTHSQIVLMQAHQLTSRPRPWRH
jgi:hypothetical protein